MIAHLLNRGRRPGATRALMLSKGRAYVVGDALTVADFAANIQHPKEGTMARMLSTLGLMTFGLVTAHAAPAGSFESYNSSDVSLSGDAAKCGLQDVERYNSYLASSLVSAGVEPDTSAAAMAKLELAAVPFADLGGKCVVVGSLDFMIPLEVSDIEMVATVTKREAIVAAFEETEMLPVVLHKRIEFTTSDANTGDGAATALIDVLVKNLAATP